MESKSVANKDKKECCGCGGCSNICPKDAVSMQYDGDGFLYPVVDSDKCIDCGLCVKKCPTEQTNLSSRNEDIKACCGRYEDLNKLKMVSSGGICDAISTRFIENGGVVYGAAYSEDFHNVVVSRIERIEELKRIRGSKYVQTIKGNVFKLIKNDINNQIPVLFIGVPCDVASVKSYIGDVSNLFTIEIICSGVTSPLVHQQFVENIEATTGKLITSFNYRKKQHGWHWPYVEAKNDEKILYNKTWSNTALGYAFGVLVRPSCYNCLFKEKHNKADVTVGDFWGLKKADKRYCRNGVSAIISYTDKGSHLLDDIPGFMTFEASYNEIRKGNPRLYSCPKEKSVRGKFAKLFKEDGLMNAYQKCLTPLDRIKMMIMQIYSILNLR